MVRVVEHSHHNDDVEMTEGVASSAPHASLAFLRQGQPCPWSSHRRQRRVLHVGESQGACQGLPHKLRAMELWQQLGSCFATLQLLQPRQTP